jgi:hypothetical protein
VHGSWSALFVRPLDDDDAAAVAHAFARPGVRVTTHVGDARFAGARVTGGPLLDLAAWPANAGVDAATERS